MQVFELAEVARQRQDAGRLYQEFLRVPALSMGLYELPTGAADPQSPHAQDEVYYVTAGRARFTVGEQDQAVATGTIIYVPAGAEHHFHSIIADLSLLVFFAPAEQGPTLPPVGHS
jgi:mannose-6-phosphate isomerase-like protein (cupin superfamily)